MTRENVFNELTELFCDLFEDEEIQLSENTTAADIDGWDSLMHLTLIYEIEKHFNIKFSMGEVQGFKNVGGLVDAILKHVQ